MLPIPPTLPSPASVARRRVLRDAGARRRLPWLAALLLAAGAAPAPAQAPPAGTELVVTASPCLNLRPTPDLASDPLRCLPEGRRLTLLESRDAWGRVRLPGAQEGWVALRLTRAAPATGSAPVPAPQAAEMAEVPPVSGQPVGAPEEQRIAELEQALAGAEAERRQALEEAAAAQAEAAGLRAEVGELRRVSERLKAASAAPEQAQDESLHLAAEANRATARAAELERALAAAEEAQDEQAQAHEAARGRVTELERALAVAEAARDERAEEQRTASGRIAELEQALAAAAAQRDEARDEAASMRGETEALRGQAAELRETNRRLEAEVAARLRAEAEGRRQLAEIEEALAALEAGAAAPEPSPGQAGGSGNQAEEELASREAQRQIEDLSGRLRAAEMFLAESEKQRRALAQEAAALRQELAAPPEALDTPSGAATAPTPPEPADPSGQAAILEMVNAWARSWSTQAVEEYLSFYATSFVPPDGQSREAWEAARRQRVLAPGRIRVEVALVDVRQPAADRVEVELVQSYQSERYSDSVVKTLELVLESGRWKIAREIAE